ncbi:hypothetical protein PRN20_04430 [Devosia sp. ZB163]|uniref:hypothetical protein n=1 Tax=Devosia sp. ZB163 TaxID=3025938 RepID=UPI00235FFD11|nr:hypothetical protein [Devosia sp. ZB163]MDC9822968.1 hypothetical protein [Devosia sp. ZB163]
MVRASHQHTEITVTDGKRHIGRLVAKGDVFACFDADDRPIGTAPTVAEARSHILRAGRRGPDSDRDLAARTIG